MAAQPGVNRPTALAGARRAPLRGMAASNAGPRRARVGTVPLRSTPAIPSCGLVPRLLSGAVGVDWAIPCRYAEVNGGWATIVGAQVDAARVTQFPARVGTWLACRVAFADGGPRAPPPALV